MLSVLDLFSGIGGFSLGLERTGGFRTVQFCEIDPFCRAILAKHWPGIPCHDDIRTFEPGPVDIVCGGFPCQDISLAGAGAGLGGSRSGLWSEMLRVIGDARPAYAIVENVAALLARGMGTVLADLDSIGFDAEWHCIPALAVGAPHRRDRVWIIAHARGDEIRQQSGRRGRARWVGSIFARHDGSSWSMADADVWRFESERIPQHGSEQSSLRRESYGRRSPRLRPRPPDTDAGGDLSRYRQYGTRPIFASSDQSDEGKRDAVSHEEHWAIEPDVGRVADGVPLRVDRLRSLGNSIVPQIAQAIGEAILRAHYE